LTYLVKNTETIEDVAIEQSDINVGVSRVDIKLFRRRKKSLWVLAGNGTNQISKTPHYPEQTRRHSIIIFIGSNHPPNYMGIESLLKDTRFMKEKGTLLLIGGVADYFRGEYPEDDLFWAGKKAIGQIDENELQKYIEQADVIVLPVNTGGGSNLKTAEAIAAHKKIVSTSFAFRGYERYELLPNVFIANTSDDFKTKLLEAIAAVSEPYTNQQIHLIEDLSWERTLHSLLIVLRYARLLLFIDSVKSAISRKLFRNRT
jgi:glycosyltransferase involved in cell wall biosynthesis